MSEPNITDWISAIASCIGVVGIGFLAYQVHLAKESLKNEKEQLRNSASNLATSIKSLVADHERSRREYSVRIISEWAKTIDRRASIARKLVETFSVEECIALSQEEPITITGKKIKLANGCLRGDSQIKLPDAVGETIELSHAQVAHIRWLISNYLNLLESIFLAAHEGIATEETIAQQFRFLVNPSENHTLLEEYRKVVNGKVTYPSIEWMSVKILKLNDPKKLAPKAAIANET